MLASIGEEASKPNFSAYSRFKPLLLKVEECCFYDVDGLGIVSRVSGVKSTATSTKGVAREISRISPLQVVVSDLYCMINHLARYFRSSSNELIQVVVIIFPSTFILASIASLPPVIILSPVKSATFP